MMMLIPSNSNIEESRSSTRAYLDW